MINKYSGEGGFHRLGYGHGEELAEAVRHNVEGFFRAMSSRGERRFDLHRRALRLERWIDPHRLEEIDGIATGARQPYPDVLAYNLFRDEAYPDGCTVAFALPDATASQKLLFFKHSDKGGRDELVGDGFHEHREINVVVALRPQGKPAVIGVAAAGSTGVKMGVNERGVVAGSNIARTLELRNRKVDVSQERALDRQQLLRVGLECETALEAGNTIVGELASRPMATPGNLEFLDPGLAYLIEGSYDQLAVQFVKQGFGVRTNRFSILHELNDPDDVSSYSRYARCTELLQQKVGRLGLQDFVVFSCDHANGPGPNSICRHGADFREETSQSVLVAEVDLASPKQSRVLVALGKPCWAWRSPQGFVQVSMQSDPNEIGEGFRTGEVWRLFQTERPFPAEEELPLPAANL